jgi:hypothetical protein
MKNKYKTKESFKIGPLFIFLFFMFFPFDTIATLYKGLTGDNRSEFIQTFTYSGDWLTFIVFGIIAFFCIKYIKKSGIFDNKKKLLEELRMRGISISATLIEIKQNPNIHVGKKMPYNVFVEGVNPITNKKMVWKSVSFWSDPIKYLQKGQIIVVYLDPQNSHKYAIDFAFLPENLYKIRG